jgi:hypothetical protein
MRHLASEAKGSRLRRQMQRSLAPKRDLGIRFARRMPPRMSPGRPMGFAASGVFPMRAGRVARHKNRGRKKFDSKAFSNGVCDNPKGQNLGDYGSVVDVAG